MESGGGGASDQEIRRLMAELVRRERAAARAARRVERVDRDVAFARMNLALRAMSKTTELERARIFALGQPITPDLILAWAAEEAASTSRIQRRRWRLFRSER